jgi:hypothetical protein
VYQTLSHFLADLQRVRDWHGYGRAEAEDSKLQPLGVAKLFKAIVEEGEAQSDNSWKQAIDDDMDS